MTGASHTPDDAGGNYGPGQPRTRPPASRADEYARSHGYADAADMRAKELPEPGSPRSMAERTDAAHDERMASAERMNGLRLAEMQDQIDGADAHRLWALPPGSGTEVMGPAELAARIVAGTGPKSLPPGVEHAARELTRSGAFEQDPEWAGALLASVMAFLSYRHSGGSASVGIELLPKLLRRESLTPLSSDPAEWREVEYPAPAEGEEPWWQNVRDPRALSRDGGKTWWYAAAINPGERAIEGDVPGVLEECSVCSGEGVVFRPDAPPAPEQEPGQGTDAYEQVVADEVARTAVDTQTPVDLLAPLLDRARFVQPLLEAVRSELNGLRLMGRLPEDDQESHAVVERALFGLRSVAEILGAPERPEVPAVDDRELLYRAWAVIANGGFERGGWDAMHPLWVTAAEAWRDDWHRTFEPDRRPAAVRTPPHVWPAELVVDVDGVEHALAVVEMFRGASAAAADEFCARAVCRCGQVFEGLAGFGGVQRALDDALAHLKERQAATVKEDQR